MNKKQRPLVYLVAGSIRNKGDNKIIIDGAKKYGNELFLYDYIEKTARSKSISNSECGLIAAAFAASKRDVRLKYISLNKYFMKNGMTRNFKQLADELNKATGIIFSLPVYFGDRSSLFGEMIDKYKKNGLDFKGKVCGFISVGAKRNGGQETTNIFGINDILNLNGIAVGNGPPTSQYGGTCVGGNIGTMSDDYFGILTSMGVGKKVAEVSEVLFRGNKHAGNSRQKPQITMLILNDKNEALFEYANRIKQTYKKIANINIVNLLNYKFHRCYACSVCPRIKENRSYKCYIKNDHMKKIQNYLIKTDAIILSCISTLNTYKEKSVYQKFMERTRYLRRDNFQLTNKLVSSFVLSELGSDIGIDIRVNTSFIRHNVILHKGLKQYLYKNSCINDEVVGDWLQDFAATLKIINSGLKRSKLDKPLYADIGAVSNRP